MKKYSTILLTLSFTVNIILVAFVAGIYTGAMPIASAIDNIRSAGTYGPDAIEIIEGDARISASGVTLQNVLITGNLYLTEGIGEGSVELVNVTVEGETIVQGGGQESISVVNSVLNSMTINKVSGTVRVALKESSQVKSVTMQGKAILSVSELDEKGFVKEVYIEKSAESLLEGNFAGVVINGKNAAVTFSTGKIDKLTTTKDAVEAVITLKEDAEIDTLLAGAPLEIAGKGSIKTVSTASPGLLKLAGNFGTVTTGGRGIFLEFGEGTTDKLVVEESEGVVMVHLAAEAAIKDMELNGATVVTGSGTIEKVAINSAGISIEQTPGSVKVADGITAEVGGKEVAAKEEPAPAPSPSPSRPAPAPSEPASPIAKFWIDSSDDSPAPTGYVIVYVELSHADAQNYSVSVKGTPLKYYGNKTFAGPVPKEDAVRSNVTVKKQSG